LRLVSRGLAAAALALALTAIDPGRAAAAAPRVVVVRPAAENARVNEAIARLSLELRAAGFDVVIAAERPASPDRAALEKAGSEHGAFAALTVSPTAEGASADVWLADRTTGKALVRRVDVSSRSTDNVATALAIRSLELLRASLAEGASAHASSGGKARPPSEPFERGVNPPGAPFAGLAIGASVALLHGFDGIGPAFGPALRLSYGGEHGLAARITVVGPTFGPAVIGALGEAEVRQELALVEAVYAPSLRSIVVPVASLSVGAYHMHATGRPVAPYQATSAGVWSALFGGGLGAALRLRDNVTLVADAHLLFAQPGAVLAIGPERLGRAGRPSLLVSLGAAVRF
jgi:hypothetical protein